MRITVFILSAALLPNEGIYAQKPQPADALIEAAKYLERGDQEMDCSTETAERWIKAAQGRLSGFRSSIPNERDTAAVLRAQAAFARDKVRQREKALNQAANDIPKLLNERRIGSALRVLGGVRREAPTCDPRFREWEVNANSRRAAAARLVKLGEEAVFNNPRAAKRFYVEGLKIDIEFPEIATKLTSADAAIRAMHTGHPVAKAIGLTVLVTALVGAAYAADQYQKRQQHLQHQVVTSTRR